MNKAPAAKAFAGLQALRNEKLSAALEQAAVANPDSPKRGGGAVELYRQLELISGLPGTRMNLPLAMAFAHDAARLGAKGDRLIFEMAELSPEAAPGATSKEFLPVCGVLAVGALVMARVGKDDTKALVDRAVALLEEKADDSRFRVREVVPIALSMVGHTMKGALTERVDSWMDRYFQAAAVILALAEPAWLETFGADEHEAPIALLHKAFMLAHDAPRSAVRYPGHKALVEALRRAPNAFVKRFGVPMFDQLQVWSETVKIPDLRDAILKNLEDAQLKKPFSDEIKRIKQAVEDSKTPPRDPSRIVQGMRGRSKKRGRH